MNTRSLWLTALVAGIVIGLLGNLPLLNLVNCILCAWVWLGGALAVWIYRRLQGAQPALTGGQGAGLGALSGVIGAVVGFGVYLLTSSLSVPIMNSLARAFNIQGEMPWNTAAGGSNVTSGLIWLAIDLVLYSGFGALGGLVMASMGKKTAP